MNYLPIQQLQEKMLTWTWYNLNFKTLETIEQALTKARATLLPADQPEFKIRKVIRNGFQVTNSLQVTIIPANHLIPEKFLEYQVASLLGPQVWKQIQQTQGFTLAVGDLDEVINIPVRQVIRISRAQASTYILRNYDRASWKGYFKAIPVKVGETYQKFIRTAKPLVLGDTYYKPIHYPQ